MSRIYDQQMYREYLREEYGCCECGYYRNMAHHPGIRCPQTGRCGNCGNDWPCEDCSTELDGKTLKKVSRDSCLK